MSTYLIPVLILGLCGLGAGILLTVASKVFHIEVDERVEKIGEALPQANCGACGYAGCGDYAEAIINSSAPTNLCRPGGSEASDKIAEILGVAAEAVTPMTAVVHCSGDCNTAKTQFDFGGIQSCKAAKRFYSGNGMCKFGCIGLGDCAAVCDNKAIIVENSLARVVTALCSGCGQCAAVCPNNIISVKPKSRAIDVLCSSQGNGKATKLACSKGCIGCKMCEKKCPTGAVTVVNSHAVIDYDKCTSCEECKAICPVKAIN